MKMKIGILTLFCLLLLAEDVAPRKILKSKVRARGKVYKIAKNTDLEMCKAVVWEMHGEIHKHALADDGEMSIYETTDMAVCMGVVKNYTFAKSTVKGETVWGMTKKPFIEDEEEEWAAAAEDPSIIDGMMLTKEACSQFCEETSMDMSETMYSRTHKESPAEIADSFCPDLLKPKEKSDKPKAKYKPVEPASWDHPSEKMMEFLREKDKSGAINELLEIEAYAPERMLEDHLQTEVSRGKEDLVCKVCNVAVKVVVSRVAELRKTPQYKDKWQRESLVSEVVQRVCHGKDYDRMQEGYYPDVAGNPPDWAENWLIQKGEGGKWGMRRLSQPMSEWGEERQEEQEEKDGLATSDRHTMRNAMVSGACKAAIDVRLSEEDGDLAELIVDHPDKDGKELGKQYCRPVCGKKKEEL